MTIDIPLRRRRNTQTDRTADQDEGRNDIDAAVHDAVEDHADGHQHEHRGRRPHRHRVGMVGVDPRPDERPEQPHDERDEEEQQQRREAATAPMNRRGFQMSVNGGVFAASPTRRYERRLSRSMLSRNLKRMLDAAIATASEIDDSDERAVTRGDDPLVADVGEEIVRVQHRPVQGFPEPPACSCRRMRCRQAARTPASTYMIGVVARDDFPPEVRRISRRGTSSAPRRTPGASPAPRSRAPA